MSITVRAVSPFSKKVVLVEQEGQYAIARLSDDFDPSNLNWKSRMLSSSMISKGNYKPVSSETPLSEYMRNNNLGKSLNTPIVIDLVKHELHKERLVKRAVQVKHANGHVTTRMQWVDPHTGEPANTTYNHTKSDQNIKKMEELDHSKHPVLHVPIDKIKRNYEQDIDHKKVRNIKEKMEQGKKLPPVILDHELNIQDGHHRYTAAMEAGLSHVPSIIRGPDKVLKKQAEDKLKGEKAKVVYNGSKEVESKSQMAIQKLSEEIKDKYGDRLKGNVSYYLAKSEVEGMLSRMWDSHIKPAVLDNIEGDSQSSDLARQRQRHMLGSAREHLDPVTDEIHPPYLQNKELCKTINDCRFGKELANKIRYHLSKSTLSINCNSLPDEALKQGYLASNLKSFIDNRIGEGEYDIFKKENEDEDPLNIFENIIDLGLDHTRQMIEYDYMGIHPLDETKPVYISYNPFNYYKGGAPGFGDPDAGGHVISVDPKVLSDCTLTTEDSFVPDVNRVAKPVDMEHLGELWMDDNSRHLLNFVKGSNREFDIDSFIREKYSPDLCRFNIVQLELQYHKPMIEPHLLKKWSENNE